MAAASPGLILIAPEQSVERVGGMKRTSIADVAAAAGVGTATVDRVLNGRGGVSVRMQERVINAARKLGIDRTLVRPQDSSLSVGVLMQARQVPFYAHLAQLFEQASPVFANHRVACNLFTYPSLRDNDVASTIRQAARTHDALIVVAQDHDMVRRALKRASLKLPVVTLITDVPDSGRIGFVGPDNYRAGRLAGELMGRMLGPAGGDVLLVRGLRSLRAIEQRESGFSDVLVERFPQVTISQHVVSDEDPELPGIEIKRVLGGPQDLRGIYNTSVGDEGIAGALIDAGRASDIVFVAHDLNEISRELLAGGAIDAVIEQDSYAQVMEAMRCIQIHLHRHAVLPTWPDYGIRAVFRESLS
jgi:LacI family transcriptional regulator